MLQVSGVAGLAAARLEAHRFAPAAVLETVESGAEFVRERGIVIVTGKSSLPVLSESIAGQVFHGSRMSQPEADRLGPPAWQLREVLRWFDWAGSCLPHPFDGGKVEWCAHGCVAVVRGDR